MDDEEHVNAEICVCMTGKKMIDVTINVNINRQCTVPEYNIIRIC